LSVTAVRAAWLAALVLAVALPFLLGGFRVYQLTLAASYAMAILGLNLLTGYSGQISLGHGAFFALGGYVTAGLMPISRCRPPVSPASRSGSRSAARQRGCRSWRWRSPPMRSRWRRRSF
jgi:ABC-type branched-subunit amino acid transport system permease subunit